MTIECSLCDLTTKTRVGGEPSAMSGTNNISMQISTVHNGNTSIDCATLNSGNVRIENTMHASSFIAASPNWDRFQSQASGCLQRLRSCHHPVKDLLLAAAGQVLPRSLHQTFCRLQPLMIREAVGPGVLASQCRTQAQPLIEAMSQKPQQ